MLKDKAMIFAEIHNGETASVFQELLSKAQELTTGEIACVALGSGIGPALSALEKSGVDRIYALDDPRLSVYHPDYFSAALMDAVRRFDPRILMIGATSMGEELAPTLGIRLDTGVAAHCMDVVLTEDDRLAQLVPAFGGKVIGEIFTPAHNPKIISIKSGILQAKALEAKTCVTEKLDASILDFSSPISVQSVSCDVPGGKLIEKADFVACSGYGMPSRESWDKMNALSERLDGACGYTRPVIEFGFVDGERNMVGTSGKSIRPKVYLGLGISGSTHHVCGMKDAGVIIAVNTDPAAEIFQVCDYKIVGDGEKILDALLEELA